MPNEDYRQTIYDNLTDAYGKDQMPDYATFNKKLDTDPNYSGVLFSNLKDYYGADQLPDSNTFTSRLSGGKQVVQQPVAQTKYPVVQTPEWERGFEDVPKRSNWDSEEQAKTIVKRYNNNYSYNPINDVENIIWFKINNEQVDIPNRVTQTYSGDKPQGFGEQAQQPLQVQPQIGVNPTAQQPVKPVEIKGEIPKELQYKMVDDNGINANRVIENLSKGGNYEMSNKVIEELPSKNAYAADLMGYNYAQLAKQAFTKGQFKEAKQYSDLAKQNLDDAEKLYETTKTSRPNVNQLRSEINLINGNYLSAYQDADKVSKAHNASFRFAGNMDSEQLAQEKYNAEHKLYAEQIKYNSLVGLQIPREELAEQKQKVDKLQLQINAVDKELRYKEWLPTLRSPQMTEQLASMMGFPYPSTIRSIVEGGERAASGIDLMAKGATHGKEGEQYGTEEERDAMFKLGALKTLNGTAGMAFGTIMTATPNGAVINLAFNIPNMMGSPEALSPLMQPVSFVREKVVGAEKPKTETSQEAWALADLVGMTILFGALHKVGSGEWKDPKSIENAKNIIDKIETGQELTKLEIEEMYRWVQETPNDVKQKAIDWLAINKRKYDEKLKQQEQLKPEETQPVETKVEPIEEAKPVTETPVEAEVKPVEKAVEPVAETPIERTAKGFHEKEVTEHAGHETAKRVTAREVPKLVISDYATINTSEFINILVENGRLPREALKKRGVQLSDEYATKLLNENADLFPKQFESPVAETPVTDIPVTTKVEPVEPPVETKPVEKAVEPVSEPINEPVNEVKPFDQRTDTEHATYIKDQFRKQFSEKGVPQEQIDGAIALMEARAKASGKGDGWYRGIEDVKSGEFNEKTKKLFQLVGEKGLSKKKEIIKKLDNAKKLEKQGLNDTEIWQKTGWQRGVDGKWRYEIDDPFFIKDTKKIKIEIEDSGESQTFPLKDVYNTENLLPLYPELKDFKVEFISEDNAPAGELQENNKKIIINLKKNGNQGTTRQTVIHELQHFVAGREGFPRGSNAADTYRRLLEEYGRTHPDKPIGGADRYKLFRQAKSEYTRSAGEVEARNAQYRGTLPKDGRRRISPLETEDVAREEQIVLFDKIESQQQIVGENAKLKKQITDNLDIARKLEGENKTPKEIRLQTGWERGADGKWKYEIEDGSAVIGVDKISAEMDKLGRKTHTITLPEIYTNAELYEIYPQLKNVKVQIESIPEIKEGLILASTFPEKSLIILNKDAYLNKPLTKFNLIHEIQHLIQTYEGNKKPLNIEQIREKVLKKYGKTKYTDKGGLERGTYADILRQEHGGEILRELYKNQIGEVEARNAERRSVMSKKEKENKLLSDTEDVARENQILFQEKGEIKKGAVETLANGRKVVHALKAPDFSTMVHEIGHVFEADLTNAERKTITDWAGTKEWNTKTSEKWSRGFERYLRDGKAPTAELKTLFEKFKTWLTDIYKTLKGSEIENKVSPEVKKIFDRLLTEQEKPKPTEPPSKSVLKQYADNQEQLYKDHIEKTLQDKGIEIGNDKELVTQEVLNEMSKNPDKSISENVEKGVDNYVEQFGEKPTTDALKDVESTTKALEEKPIWNEDGVGEKYISFEIQNKLSTEEKAKRIDEDRLNKSEIETQLDNFDKNNKDNVIQKKKDENRVDNKNWFTISKGKNKGTYNITESGYHQMGFYRPEKSISNASRADAIKFIENRSRDYHSVGTPIIDGELISKAYHAAKKDGSNPELVKAVEDLLGKKETTKPTVAETATVEAPKKPTRKEKLQQKQEKFNKLDEEIFDLWGMLGNVKKAVGEGKNEYKTDLDVIMALVKKYVERFGLTIEQAIDRIRKEAPDEYKKVIDENKGEILSKKEIGLTHKETAKMREELGLPEMEKPVKHDTELLQQAEEKIKGGINIDKLANDIIKGKNISADVASDVAYTILSKAAAEIDSRLSNPQISEKEFNELFNRQKKLIEAAEKTGSENGRGLGVRSRIKAVQEDSISDFLMSATERNKGAELTEEQIKQERKEFEELKKSKEDLEKELERLKADAVKKAAKQELDNLKSEAKKQRRSVKKEKLDDELDDLSKEFSKIVWGQLHAGFNPKLIGIVAKMAKNRVEKGIVNLADVVDNIHDSIKGYFTKEQIEEIIAGEHNEKKATRNELQKQKYELQQEARAVTKLRRLQEGEQPKTEQKKRQQNQRIFELQKQIKEHDLTKLAQYEARMQRQIDKLQDKLDKGEFMKEPPKVKVKLTPQARELTNKYIRLKQERDIRIMREEYNNRKALEKVRDIVIRVLNTPRTIMASMDYSAPLRQGIIAMAAHPIIGGKAFGKMFKFSASEKEFDRWFYELKGDPLYPIAKESKLYIADPMDLTLNAKEEMFGGSYAEQIPGLKIPIKASERAYVGFLNKVRWDLFKNMVDRFESQGKTYDNSPELYKAAADYINTMTGRGRLGKLENSAATLNSVLFAPRLIASRIKMLTNFMNPSFYMKTPKEVRVEYFKDMGKFIGLGMTVIALAKLGGAEVEDDPRSTDFGKIKIGNSRWDIWGGFGQYIRVITQLLTGQSKSTQTGIIRELNGEDVFGQTRGDVAIRFARGKLAPVPSMVADFMTGRKVTGEEISAKNEVLDRIVPLIYSDIKDAYKDKGVSALFSIGVPAMFGVGVQTFDNRDYVQKIMDKRKNPKPPITEEEKLQHKMERATKEQHIKEQAEKYGIEYVPPKKAKGGTPNKPHKNLNKNITKKLR